MYNLIEILGGRKPIIRNVEASVLPANFGLLLQRAREKNRERERRTLYTIPTTTTTTTTTTDRS
jgi:hypothetical protein